MKKTKEFERGCQDCGFYHNCPMDYMCPGMELFTSMMEHPEKTAIMQIDNCIFIRTPKKNNEPEIEEEDE